MSLEVFYFWIWANKFRKISESWFSKHCLTSILKVLQNWNENTQSLHEVRTKTLLVFNFRIYCYYMIKLLLYKSELLLLILLLLYLLVINILFIPELHVSSLALFNKFILIHVNQLHNKFIILHKDTSFIPLHQFKR